MELSSEIHDKLSIRNLSVADFLELKTLNTILNWEQDPYCHEIKHNNETFDVPVDTKQRSSRTYDEPRNVSMGPHHYGKPELHRMQVDKMRSFRHFVKRGRHPMKVYIEALMGVVTPCRKSYGELKNQWKDDDRFVLLMLIDGVFLLEFLSVTRGNQNSSDYDATDPTFGHKGHKLIYDAVMQDLLTVDNQVPYLILSTLLSISEGLPEQSIHSILSWMMFAPNIDPGLHFLDMYLKGFLEEGQHIEEEKEEEVVEEEKEEHRSGNIAASKLYKRGVKFVGVQSYKKISFDKYTATLTLAIFHITKKNISTLLNMIAFERREGKKCDLNSYVNLVDSLVQSPKDVKLLRSRGIIVNKSSSSDKTVMNLIKQISKYAMGGGVTDNRSDLVGEEIIRYYESGATKMHRRFYENLFCRGNLHQQISRLPSKREFPVISRA